MRDNLDQTEGLFVYNNIKNFVTCRYSQYKYKYKRALRTRPPVVEPVVSRAIARHACRTICMYKPATGAAKMPIRNYNNGSDGVWLPLCATHLQCDSPRGDDTQSPPFLQGLGEHDTKPETMTKKSGLFYFLSYIILS